MYGESQQANYLIGAKGRNSETKVKRELFNERTNTLGATTAFDAPVSPFKDQSVNSMRVDQTKDAISRTKIDGIGSPVKSFDYKRN